MESLAAECFRIACIADRLRGGAKKSGQEVIDDFLLGLAVVSLTARYLNEFEKLSCRQSAVGLRRVIF